MGFVQIFQQKWTYFTKCAASVAAIFLVAFPGCAQTKPAPQQTEMPWTKDLNKYPGLLPEFGKLVEKLKQNIQFPPARTESRLLPLMPASTMTFAAFPNYGDVTQQALKIFRQELLESAVLRDWWGHGELATGGPKLEESIEKLYQLQQFLGEEIVVSGVMDGPEPSLLVLAEVHKPGLQKFLEQLLLQAAGSAKPGIRVFGPQELAVLKDGGASQTLYVLVRSDYVVASSDLATLRGFNAKLEKGTREFAVTPFGQRIGKEYATGVTVLGAADLHSILNKIPPSAKENANFQRSGFADVKYVIWDHKDVASSTTKQTISQTELSFNSPRHGSASWLAKPGPLSSLDFVSPKAIVAGTVVLTSFSQVFDDLKVMEGTSSQSPFASLAAFEKILNLSLKDDLLKYLTGEITLELDSVNPPAKPVWKAILNVNDAGRLQKTLSTLLAAAHLQTQSSEDGGVTYYRVPIPSGETSMEIGYAFVDGHLIIGSSPEVTADAVRWHASGASLGKSQRFLAALPPGHPAEASALLYEDPAAMTALSMRQVAPEMAGTLAQFSKESQPAVVCVYGEESAIRTVSKSGTFDVGGALIVAAIAIPNLLRSRMAANEATAVGSLRTVNTAEITYATAYAKRGYAPDLATLGLDPRNPKAQSPDHAGLLDATLANDSCTANAWCTKSGYRFRVTTLCKQQPCKEYLAVGTPVDSNTGVRSFCSASDGVIRYKTGASPNSPANVAECRTWAPLQ
jgi:type IV pilus assembly protein PilA